MNLKVGATVMSQGSWILTFPILNFRRHSLSVIFKYSVTYTFKLAAAVPPGVGAYFFKRVQGFIREVLKICFLQLFTYFSNL